jgi:hypothetical protein
LIEPDIWEKIVTRKIDYMVVILWPIKVERAGKPHEMTQAQSNHTKKPPISTKTEHILSHIICTCLHDNKVKTE